MSMEVDLSKPLTDAERAYLESRGRTAEIERADAIHGVDTPPPGQGDGTGPVSHGTSMVDVRDQRIADLERELALLRGDDGSNTEDEDTEEVAPYEEWTVKELDAELKRRNLPVTGDKTAKATALYDHDEASGLSAV